MLWGLTIPWLLFDFAMMCIETHGRYNLLVGLVTFECHKIAIHGGVGGVKSAILLPAVVWFSLFKVVILCSFNFTFDWCILLLVTTSMYKVCNFYVGCTLILVIHESYVYIKKYTWMMSCIKIYSCSFIDGVNAEWFGEKF